jgi:hypothetical protein
MDNKCKEEIKMKCPKCKSNMELIEVSVEGATKKVKSYQCDCGYFEFDKKTGKEVIKEIEEKNPLKIKHRFIKISHDRIGNYWNENVIKATGIKAGGDFLVSVPDKKHILISLL